MSSKACIADKLYERDGLDAIGHAHDWWRNCENREDWKAIIQVLLDVILGTEERVIVTIMMHAGSEKANGRAVLQRSAASVRGKRRWLRIPVFAAVAFSGAGLALLVACDFDEACSVHIPGWLKSLPGKHHSADES